MALGEEFCKQAQLTISSEGVKVTKPTSAEADISSIYKIDSEDCNQIITDIEPAASAKAKEVGCPKLSSGKHKIHKHSNAVDS